MIQPWGVMVSPFPEELFSTWLVRAALFMGCNPLVLTGSVWGKWRSWMVDIDRGLTQDKMDLLCKASGIKADRFEKMMLKQFSMAVCGESVGSKSILPWFLTLGSRNRKRHGGLQFCPQCFTEDKEPYFRYYWRLAWHTGCLKHNVSLLDRCTNCHAPVSPNRLLAEDQHLAVCYSCKSDLRLIHPPEINSGALGFQIAADQVLAKGHGEYGAFMLEPHQWFLLNRYFITLLRQAAVRQNQGYSSEFIKSLGINADDLVSPATGLMLEMLPVDERVQLLGQAWIIFMAGPDKFLSAALNNSVTVQMLSNSRQSFPVGLEHLIKFLPNKDVAKKTSRLSPGKKPRSKQSVMRMYARLQRKLTGKI